MILVKNDSQLSLGRLKIKNKKGVAWMRFSKVFLLSMLLVMVIMIAGFSVGSAAPVQVDYWVGFTGPDRDIMKSLVDEFNSTHPQIQVNMMSLQWTPLFSKFMIEVRGGTPPDILTMHLFEMGQFVNAKLLDANMVKSVGLKKTDYSSKLWNASMYSNVQYAVPLDYQMHGLFYNKEIFGKAGITSPPATGEELIKIGQKLTIDKNGKNATEAGFDPQNIVQYGLGMMNNHHGFYMWWGLMNQQGENKAFTATMKKATFNDAKAAKAWAFLEDLVFKYHIVPKGEKSPFDDFKVGKVAMLIDGPWEIPGLDKVADLKYETAPFPQVFQHPGVWGANTLLTFPVKAKSPKQQAALTFVKWLTNNSAAWAQCGMIPAKLATLSEIKNLPHREAFISETNYVYFLPPLPKAIQVFSSVAPSPILTASQNILLNNKPVEEVVSQMKKDIDMVLDK